MIDPVSIGEAAERLELSPARVRAMAAHGQLPAKKIGDRWLIERAAVEERRSRGAHGGRRFAALNAWALLLLASGEDVEGIDSSVRSRLRRALRLEGLELLGPRLSLRGDQALFKAHPGEVAHLLRDPAFMASGISAAASVNLGLVSGREADGYLPERSLRKFVRNHALSPVEVDGNVRLRVVPNDVWKMIDGRPVAPEAAVALDLSEEADPRSARAGRDALRRIDRDYRAQSRARRK
jgi:excisionase family DNA binding protein